MNKTLQKNKSIGIDHLFILIVFVLVLIEYIANMFSTDKTLTSIYLVQMFLCLGVSGFKAFRQLGALHIFTLMHLMLLVFAFGGVIAGIFSPLYDYREMLSPDYVKFSEMVIQKTTLLYTVYICSLFLFFWYAYKKWHFNLYENNQLSTSREFLYIGKRMMWVAFPFQMVYSVKMFIYATGDLGRLLLYQGGGDAIGMPLYLRITNILFTGGYYMIVASIPPQKSFIKYSLLYFVPLIPTLLAGERGAVIVPVIFVLWYLYRQYGARIKIGKLAIVAFGIITVCFVIAMSRVGEEIGGVTLSTILLGFLSSSASGFRILSSYILYEDVIYPHPYPFVFDSFVAGLIGVSGQSYETLNARASIGHQLVYTINPEYYLSGASMGTNYVTECYEFGVLGVIIGALVLVLILAFFETRMRKNRFLLIFMLPMFTQFVLCARSSLFVGATDFIKYSLLTFMTLRFYNFAIKKERKNEKCRCNNV